MSDDNNSILNLSDKSRLGAEVGLLMLKGAGWAAIFVFVVWAGIAVIAGVGKLLPAESREAPDPSPWSMVEPVLAAPADHTA